MVQRKHYGPKARVVNIHIRFRWIAAAFNLSTHRLLHAQICRRHTTCGRSSTYTDATVGGIRAIRNEPYFVCLEHEQETHGLEQCSHGLSQAADQVRR